MEKRTQYDVHNMNFKKFIAEMEDAEKNGYDFSHEYETLLTSADPNEVVAFLESHPDTTVETYTARFEDGEWVFHEGSDYDYPQNFIRRTAPEKTE